MSTIKVILFDLWKTLVTSHCREPVWNLQKVVGHKFLIGDNGQEQFEPDDKFLEWCLTTPIADPRHFLEQAANRFGSRPQTDAVEQFQRIIQGESGCVARFWDVNRTLASLREAGYELGVVSNLWPFPAEHIFEVHGLGEFFPRESRVYSFEVGHRKPDPEIFEDAARRFNVHPSQCLMVGDNLQADVIGALKVGMNAALIDRPAEVPTDAVPTEALRLTNLEQLLPILVSSETAA